MHGSNAKMQFRNGTIHTYGYRAIETNDSKQTQG